MQAVILAGGFGTRLQDVIKDVPKPMAKIGNLPFLTYLFTYLKNQQFTDVVLSVGYLKEKIIDYFGNSYLGINIQYAIEDKPLGTGGAILNSLKFIDETKPVVVLNGDTFLRVDYQKLIYFHHNKESDLTIVLRHLQDSGRYGSVIIDEQSSIVNFSEKVKDRSALINGGVYILNPRVFAKYNPPQQFSFEQDFLSKNLSSIKSFAFPVDDYFIDIGVPEDYKIANLELPKLIKNKALFLDRDGVINVDYGYVHKIENFHFVDGIFELCQEIQQQGYLIFVMTNQAGIAKGYYTEEQFLELTRWMESEFLNREIKIIKTYYCPYHIDGVIEKYKKDSLDRKPNPGMFLKAITNFNIDPEKSIMIGDKESDIIAAKSANVGQRILYNCSDSMRYLLNKLLLQ
ncbi:MAG: D-glycero-alpha-D-manno-heptose,7-bisphosphate 7-phosphatase [Rickettsiaceae bacterium]|jgi:D,D-heptose 1,7-bisphosphate phosphatase|nr:D-glycero-alpha-D-manno-heptose,7-bisphosphate 7-phosphatase [Rickettsiaceae bacterium]